MSALPMLATYYAIDGGESTGPTYATEAEARRQPEHEHLGFPVVRLYVAEDGRIVHTETLAEEPT